MKEGGFITIYYDDIDRVMCDLREYSEVLYKKCNELKRTKDGEQSVQYDLLEDYFYKLNVFLCENQNTILCNLVNIIDVDIPRGNMFYDK